MSKMKNFYYLTALELYSMLHIDHIDYENWIVKQIEELSLKSGEIYYIYLNDTQKNALSEAEVLDENYDKTKEFNYNNLSIYLTVNTARKIINNTNSFFANEYKNYINNEIKSSRVAKILYIMESIPEGVLKTA